MRAELLLTPPVTSSSPGSSPDPPPPSRAGRSSSAQPRRPESPVSFVSFTLNGEPVEVAGPDGFTLLDALRESLGIHSVKDGCSPQGQCGCCTVLVDGSARVACVTPLARVAGREVTTLEGIDDADRWAAVMSETGASQCGFCTPGIIVRASTMAPDRRCGRGRVDRMLLAHLCRCTGWQPIRDAIAAGPAAAATTLRDAERAARRAQLEGGVAQAVLPSIAAGEGGFSDDGAPTGALVAVLDADGAWIVDESVTAARRRAGKVQGRRSTAALRWPVELPAGEWIRTLQTTWVEPGYLEPDASWCEPGGEPASPLGNGGAFGGKLDGEVAEVARRLADEHGRPVRALYSREDVVRRGPKRPPLAIGVDAHRGGVLRIAHSGAEDDDRAIAAGRDGLTVAGFDPERWQIELVDVTGPPTSVALRGAIGAELLAVAGSLGDPQDHAELPSGAAARATLDDEGLSVRVHAGDPLDEAVLRSYCTGAAHAALGMVRSEGIALDDRGVPVDLTIRSFGILRAHDTPPIHIDVEPAAGAAPLAVSDAVFAAVLAAAWRETGFTPRWPART